MTDGPFHFDVITVYIEVHEDLLPCNITVGMVREKVWEQWDEDLASTYGWNEHNVFFKFFTHDTLDPSDFVEPNTDLLGIDDEDEEIGIRLIEDCQRLQAKLINTQEQ